MATFTDIPGLRQSAEVKKQALIAELRQLAAKQDELRPQIHSAQQALSEKKATLASNPQATALASLEARIQAANEANQQLRGYIEATLRDTEYAAPKAAVLAALGELNILLQRQQLQPGPSLDARLGYGFGPAAAGRGEGVQQLQLFGLPADDAAMLAGITQW